MPGIYIARRESCVPPPRPKVVYCCLSWLVVALGLGAGGHHYNQIDCRQGRRGGGSSEWLQIPGLGGDGTHHGRRTLVFWEWGVGTPKPGWLWLQAMGEDHLLWCEAPIGEGGNLDSYGPTISRMFTHADHRLMESSRSLARCSAARFATYIGPPGSNMQGGHIHAQQV
jgi:hypothetical protein